MGWIGLLFGAIREAKRAKARVDKFNARWHRLTHIHRLVTNEFVEPLNVNFSKLTVSEQNAINNYVGEMNEWFNAIRGNINNSGLKHLSRYATAIKKTAMKSMIICKKYGIYSDIVSVEYDASRKVLLLNGRDHYCFK